MDSLVIHLREGTAYTAPVDAGDVERLVAKLGDPDAVLTFEDRRRSETVYLPVRGILRVDHTRG